jgi:hypothetical protein
LDILKISPRVLYCGSTGTGAVRVPQAQKKQKRDENRVPCAFFFPFLDFVAPYWLSVLPPSIPTAKILRPSRKKKISLHLLWVDAIRSSSVTSDTIKIKRSKNCERYFTIRYVHRAFFPFHWILSLLIG